MAKDPFAPAFRSEIEALVSRYEALSMAHQEALAIARDQEVSKLRQDLATLLADRERSRASEADLRSQLKASQERSSQLEHEISEARKQLSQALHRMEILQHESVLALEKERVASRVVQENLRAESAKVIEEERAVARSAQEALQAQLDVVRSEAQQQLAEAQGTLREVQQEAESLSEAFSSEIAFIKACFEIEGTALHEAIRQAMGSDLMPSPGTYSTLKARRPDAVLATAFKERGRLVATIPLTSQEQASLALLATASGCELIEPEHGTRFSSSAMDKASTKPDPAEEGNVLACLMPGLRLAGTEGALVFPRVLVATG